jgi:hypothetical protein
MDMQSALGTVRAHLDLAAHSGDAPTRRAAATLVGTVEPAVQLALQDAALQLAQEVSAQIAPDAVQLQVSPHGLDAVVTGPVAGSDGADGACADDGVVGPDSADRSAGPDGPEPIEADDPPEDEGPAVRVSFRPPQQLKDRLDAAAAAEGLSLNAFLVRTLSATLDDAAGTSESRTHAQGKGRRNRNSGRARVKGWYA